MTSLKMDHVGIVVKSIEDAIICWEQVFGYKQMTHVVENSKQKVRVVFMEKENSLPIKLVSPVDETSPVFKFARKGGGLHHLCFFADNVDDEVTRLKTLGNRVLVPPEPGEAFMGEKISFLHVKNCGNVEVIDSLARCFL